MNPEADYSTWFVEFCRGLKRVPLRMIRLQDLDAVLNQEIEENGDVDLFTSVYRYPDADPNIGPVIGGLVFDLDDAENPENARREAVKLVNYLKRELEISEKSLDVCFSGYKGFSIVVNRRAFDFEPNEKLPLVHKSMVKEIAEALGLKTIDLKIYERRRLWRLVNTRNSKSGLFKIRLTSQELENMFIEDIRQLAMSPRSWRVEINHQYSEKARRFYLKHKKLVEEKLREKPALITPSSEYRGQDPPCIQRLLQGVEEGSRNNACFILAVYFAKQGLDLGQILSRLAGWNEKNVPPLEASELEATVKSAFQGVAENRYSIGCSNEVLETHCDVSKCALVKKGYIPESLRSKAEAFLKDPNLIERFLKNQEKVYGVVRDENVRKLCLLSYVSAYTDTPLPLTLQQIFSSGRTFIALKTAAYFPPEDTWQIGKLSPTALIHGHGSWDEEKKAWIVNLERKILVFAENPRFETLEMLRPLLSHDSYELMHRIAEKTKSGRISTTVAILRGWPVFVFAGSRMPASEEYKSRWLTASPDIRGEKIEAAIFKHAEKLEYPGRFVEDEETRVIKAAVQILRENHPIRVKIPFASKLAKHFRKKYPEDMRWFNAFTWLIKASAALHMFQRNRDAEGYVEASLRDLEVAYEIFRDFEFSTASGLGQHLITFWQALKEKGDTHDYDDAIAVFNQAFQKGISKRALKEFYLDQLEAGGFIDFEEDPEDKRRKRIKVLEPRGGRLFDYEAFMKEVKRGEKVAAEPVEKNSPPPEKDAAGEKQACFEFKNTYVREVPLLPGETSPACEYCGKPGGSIRLRNGGIHYVHDACLKAWEANHG
jgi:hypothetical protein